MREDAEGRAMKVVGGVIQSALRIDHSASSADYSRVGHRRLWEIESRK